MTDSNDVFRIAGVRCDICRRTLKDGEFVIEPMPPYKGQAHHECVQRLCKRGEPLESIIANPMPN